MRKITRPDAPAVLAENCHHWNRQWKNRKTENPAASFNWYVHAGRSARDWILADLAAMTQDHCAFCDGYTVEPDSVEHFRPKNDPRFLDLAYSWENLFFCCGGCQNHKREQWDDDLINPDGADYRFARYFEFDFTTGALIPNVRAAGPDQQRAETTIRVYGLDTQQRRRWRLDASRRWRRTTGVPVDEFPYRNFIEEP